MYGSVSKTSTHFSFFVTPYVTCLCVLISSPNHQFLLIYPPKFVVIGDTGSGKSSVLLRFTDNDFANSYTATVAVDFRHRTVQVGGKSCKLQIWDSAGQERYRTITSSYYRGADAIILVYDVTSDNSLRHINDWLMEVQRYAAPDACKLLIGNKCDLESARAVPKSAAQEFADSLEIPLVETSAKDGKNIDDAFIQLTEELIRRKTGAAPGGSGGGGGGGDGKGGSVKLGKDGKEKKGTCC
jgi:Ras-related protein Rab-1A